ncbi:MAG: B12-binding domain-containing radical SAM protein [Candidatus Desulfaltia sp.]|nr:B12-binding domain-containing radical SAM protein [Candidatus Desulfaltia sp.]
MNYDTPNILLVNPWICDFAAYDFWAKPMGLLTLASILRLHGYNVYYIDCLDRFHQKAVKTDPHATYGRGPYLKTRIPKPDGLEDVSRNYSRYGIREEWFRDDLLSIPKPDLILVTSLMTYWHQGVRHAVDIIKETYPNALVVLGGIYATLCQDHAELHSGADKVITGQSAQHILKLAEKFTGFAVSPKYNPDNPDTYPYPAFNLQRKISYIPILTSTGCPFSCTYCASHFLNPKRALRSPESVVEEICYWHEKYGVIDFVFYDDALLVNAEKHAVPILEKIIQTGINLRFHTPNAVHVQCISNQTADLMYKAGFKTLRLGLETAAFEKRKDFDKKVTEDEFMKAVACLKNAGFNKDQVGAYLLAGLPGQTINSIEDSIKTVKQNNITPVIAYYSPIPHTAMWEKAVASSRYELESDPVFSNNSILPCQKEPFSWETISHLKNLAAS